MRRALLIVAVVMGEAQTHDITPPHKGEGDLNARKIR